MAIVLAWVGRLVVGKAGCDVGPRKSFRSAQQQPTLAIQWPHGHRRQPWGETAALLLWYVSYL